MAAGVKLGKMGPFEFNPRGNVWYNDESTFGHKLLSKMGWSKGKGLGKNEDGIKENIKVSKKDDHAGVGFKNDAHISVGCVEYENILNKLQQHFKSKETKTEESNSQADLESLEQRSRNSRNRLHYQKFMRGKDLFRRSEKDMKCIFLENPKDSVNEDLKEDTKKESPTFKSELTVKDYFAMKMQKKFGVVPKVEVKEESDYSESETPPVCSFASNKRRKKTSENPVDLKRIKLECEELLDELSSSTSEIDPIREESCEPNHANEMFSTQNKRKKPKVVKSKKKHLHKLPNLKSCIKSSFSYNLDTDKKVSFNEEVSYKILDSSTENGTDMLTEENSEEESEKPNCSFTDENTDDNQEEDSLYSNNEAEVSEDEDDTEEVATVNENDVLEDITSDQEACDKPKCFDLPKCSASNYNFWLESQRAAVKMKLYKGMVKKMKRHRILRTSNLLDIKGYGNWGI